MRHLAAEDPDWISVVDQDVVDGSVLALGRDWDEAGLETWTLGLGQRWVLGFTWSVKG
jgi:hypothetical protein